MDGKHVYVRMYICTIYSYYDVNEGMTTIIMHADLGGGVPWVHWNPPFIQQPTPFSQEPHLYWVVNQAISKICHNTNAST